MSFARRRDFMQRAARQAAAERSVNGFDAERQDACIVADPGAFCRACRTLA
ncbi:MAG: hypothetical protein WDN48_08310 [Pseudolabrys sp.]